MSLDGQSAVELLFKYFVSDFELEVHLCLFENFLLILLPVSQFLVGRLRRILIDILSVVLVELKLSEGLLLLVEGIFILKVLMFIHIGLVRLLILHLDDLGSEPLNLLIVVDGGSVMRIDHHGALRRFPATFGMPAHLRVHADDVVVGVSCEEGVGQTCIEHVNQFLDGGEQREMVLLQIGVRCWHVYLSFDFILLLEFFLLKFDELQQLFPFYFFSRQFFNRLIVIN